MLAIRMQRTGRKGHAMFRVIVQDARRTPTSGKVVARIGSYDPHGKAVTLDKEKASYYLEHGAQPSERVVRLLQGEGIKLPDWVKAVSTKERTVRNPDKRRSTRPPEPEAPAEEPTTVEAPVSEEPAETSAEEAATEEQSTEETPAEKPADDPASEEPTAKA
jgi:small subunit ribosomal protein S16